MYVAVSSSDAHWLPVIRHDFLKGCLSRPTHYQSFFLNFVDPSWRSIVTWSRLFKGWITLSATAIQWISVNKTNHAIRWIAIYPVDSVIHFLNNPALDLHIAYSSMQYDGFAKTTHTFVATRRCIEVWIYVFYIIIHSCQYHLWFEVSQELQCIYSPAFLTTQLLCCFFFFEGVWRF